MIANIDGADTAGEEQCAGNQDADCDCPQTEMRHSAAILFLRLLNQVILPIA